MIGFQLSDEQLALRDMVRKFAKNEMVPRASEHDQSGEFPWEVFEHAHKLGIFTAAIPEQYGGLGLGYFDECLVTEELAAGCTGMSTAVMASFLGQIPILLAGTDAQKEKYLGPCSEKLTFAAFALTEPNAGSDVAGMQTTATKQNAAYILNGGKCFITNGGVADYLVVFAKTDKAKGHKGISAFIVEKDMPGFQAGKDEDKMGQRCSNTVQLQFDNLEVPAENMLGPENAGFMLAMQTLDCSRPAVAASSVGVAQAAMDYAIAYAAERTAFGQPIADFQAIQFMLADMAKDIEASRLLTWQCAWMLDQGMDATKFSSYAKCFAADTAMRVTTDAVQIFGGYGYIKDYPVEKLMRDAKLMQIYEGTNQIQRVVIARHLLKNH